MVVYKAGAVYPNPPPKGSGWSFYIHWVKWEVKLYVREWDPSKQEWDPWQLKDTWSSYRENLNPYGFRDPKWS